MQKVLDWGGTCLLLVPGGEVRRRQPRNACKLLKGNPFIQMIAHVGVNDVKATFLFQAGFIHTEWHCRKQLTQPVRSMNQPAGPETCLAHRQKSVEVDQHTRLAAQMTNSGCVAEAHITSEITCQWPGVVNPVNCPWVVGICCIAMVSTCR